jgi:hypothetical protein
MTKEQLPTTKLLVSTNPSRLAKAGGSDSPPNLGDYKDFCESKDGQF